MPAHDLLDHPEAAHVKVGNGSRLCENGWSRGVYRDPAPPFESGHPDRAPAAIKSALLSGRYEEARSAFRAGIDKATRL